jgi:hypothetical protein
MVYSPIGWIDNETPLSATNMNHMEAGISAAVPQNGPTPADTIGYNLNGSADVGIDAQAHPLSLGSGSGVVLKMNNHFDGTSDRFINPNTGALQLLIGATYVAVRKSTNTPLAGAIITWGNYSYLFGP